MLDRSETNEFLVSQDYVDQEQFENESKVMDDIENKNNQVSDQERVCCNICNRKFIIERIQKHQEACEKSKFKSEARKKLLIKKGLLKEKIQPQLIKEEIEVKQAKWKEDHEGFLEIIRYNRKIKEIEKQGGDVRTIKPPVQKIPSDYVFCELCKRNFAPNVAERHLPKCRDIISKPKPPLNSVRQTQQQWSVEGEQQKINFTSTLGQVFTKKIDKTQFKWMAQKDEINQKIDFPKRKLQISTQNNLLTNSKEQIIEKSVVIKQQQITNTLNEESDDSKYQTQTTMQSKSRVTQKLQQKKSIHSKEQLDISPEKNGSEFLRTTDKPLRALPNLKNSNYKNWTNPGFVDCITRATIMSNTDCPHCGRKFIARAAERHIPICEKIKQNLIYRKIKQNGLPFNKKIIDHQSQINQLQQYQQQGQQTSDQIQQIKQYNILPPPKPKQMAQFKSNSVQKVQISKDINDTFELGIQATKFCTYCGIKFQFGHKYCGGCGKKREIDNKI